ncbi:MAG: HDOD domain-containing protein [Acidobacteriota bacterium]
MAQLGQAEKPHNYPNALYKEIALFRPSTSVQQTNSLLNTTPVDLRRLGAAARNDPDLAVETVRFCNSSLFRLPRPVSSLEQAVVATNAETVRILLLTCWLTRLSGSKVAMRENQLFWSHSLLAAQISRRISEWTGLVQPEQAFLAGLLHDVGNLPFLTLFSSGGVARQQGLFEDLGESIESQRRRFGTDHCELGERLAVALGFPFPLAEVVSKHHQPGDAIRGFPLLSIVGAAEAITQASHDRAKQEIPAEVPGTFIKDSLRKWLPGLNPDANTHLIAALEADLLANARRFAPEAGRVWSDSLPGSAPKSKAEKGTCAGG